MTDRPTPQQQQILDSLSKGDRVRLELLPLTGNDYQALKRAIDPLIAQKLVTYHFSSEDTQRFRLTPQGKAALEQSQPQSLPQVS